MTTNDESFAPVKQPVAIVTGASSGIGLGITQKLLECNYRVVANSRSISKSTELTPLDELVLIDGNVGEKKTAVKIAEAAIQHFGRIDLLINNAGIYLPKPFADYTEEDFANMVSTNIASYFFMTQQVIPQMKKQKSGHIVNIATTLAQHPVAGAALTVLTKSTMPQMSRALALEYAADGIRVNTVSPGVVNTPMHAKDDHAALAKFAPLGRLAEVSDIVDAILYLNSATFVTGEDLRVDGGSHAGKW